MSALAANFPTLLRRGIGFKNNGEQGGWIKKKPQRLHEPNQLLITVLFSLF